MNPSPGIFHLGAAQHVVQLIVINNALAGKESETPQGLVWPRLIRDWPRRTRTGRIQLTKFLHRTVWSPMGRCHPLSVQRIFFSCFQSQSDFSFVATTWFELIIYRISLESIWKLAAAANRRPNCTTCELWNREWKFPRNYCQRWMNRSVCLNKFEIINLIKSHTTLR